MPTSSSPAPAQAERQMDRGIADNERGWTPRPDPTVLTTDQLRREIAGLRDLFEVKNTIIEIRFEAQDKALSVLQNIADRQPWPAVLEERTLALREVMMQMFSTDSVKFTELDKRTEALTAAGKIAIDAAFKAQQEAASKQEAQFTKVIDQTRELTQSGINGLQAQIQDLKSRLDKGEGAGHGRADQVVVQNRTEDQSAKFFSMGISVIVMLIGVGALAISFMK